MKANRYLWALFFLLLAATGRASGQSSVEPRVEKLEETVRVLERRLANLEEQLRQRSAPASVPLDKITWRKLQKGMSEVDVEKLLGSPSKVDVLGPFTIWYYGYPLGGQVRFDAKSGAVAWSEP